MTSAGFNRRMRKTACPVVWKGCGAQSPQPHPISRAEEDLHLHESAKDLVPATSTDYVETPRYPWNSRLVWLEQKSIGFYKFLGYSFLK